jgi:hypothetical protein
VVPIVAVADPCGLNRGAWTAACILVAALLKRCSLVLGNSACALYLSDNTPLVQDLPRGFLFFCCLKVLLDKAVAVLLSMQDGHSARWHELS